MSGARVKRPVQRRFAHHRRIVPLAAAEIGELFRPGRRHDLREERRLLGSAGHEHRVHRAGLDQRGDRVALVCPGALVEAIALDRHHPAAGIGDRPLQRRLHDRAIGVVGQERGEGAPALGGGVADDSVDVALRQEAQEIHPGRCRRRIGGEGDHQHMQMARATCATAFTDWANSGPMISWAPGQMAALAAARAPSMVPRSSLTRHPEVRPN